MTAVPTIDDLRLLVAVLTQLSPENQSLPSPDHIKLAEQLGFNDRKASKSKWHQLVTKMREGKFGDLSDLGIVREPKENGGKKRAIVEVPVDGTNEPGSSPTKKAK